MGWESKESRQRRYRRLATTLADAKERGIKIECRRCHEDEQASQCQVHGGQIICNECHCEIGRNNRCNNPFTYRCRDSRFRAKKAGVPHTIDSDYVAKLWKLQGGLCHYSGLPMKFPGETGSRDPYVFSIDRIEGSGGYVPGNVVLCLDCINRFKGIMATEELILVAKAIAKRHGRKT